MVLLFVGISGSLGAQRGVSRLEPFGAMTIGAQDFGNVQTVFKIFSHWGQSKTMTFL